MADDAMGGQPDPFAKLTAEEAAGADAAAGKGTDGGEIWSPIVPAPSEPPPAEQIRHWKHGTATQAWVYRSATGEPLFLTVRFDFARPDGEPGKEILPYAYGFRAWRPRTGPNARELTQQTGWQFKRPSRPVPLYGLDRLSAQPGATVLVCEGERRRAAAAPPATPTGRPLPDAT
jgi:hypothetical protein